MEQHDRNTYGDEAPRPVEPEPTGGCWWACAESYPASGRPSRLWAQWTGGPDIRPDDDVDDADHAGAGPAYPFNGMGGSVVAGPFATRQEAEAANAAAVHVDSAGYLQWK